jgi:protein O-GlcNAc transferase
LSSRAPVHDVDALPRLFQEGRYAELEAAARSLLQSHPRHGGLWKALGAALAAQGRNAEAMAAKERAVLLRPEDAEARLNWGNALAAEGRLDDAIAQFAEAARLSPDSPAAWTALARPLLARGRNAQAEAALRKVLALAPSAGAHNNLGNLLRELHRMPEAERSYRAALQVQPDFAEAANNLANTLADLGQIAEAETWYRRAIELAPTSGAIRNNLGNLLKDQGRLAEAQQCYRECLQMQPDAPGLHSNLLLAMNYDAALPAAALVDEARRYGALAQTRAGAPLSAGSPACRDGPLRVGLVSGDLRAHPVAYFLEGWLPHVDRKRLELVAYATLAREDEVTARLKPHFTAWHSLVGLHAEAAARTVHGHGIDLLIDLSGHTAYNRLDVFAWRPAPVQASWLGYFATTGLPAMDWLLADRTSVPGAGQQAFTERIWYMPETRLCFAAPAGAPEAADAPSLRHGAITFGSFQNLGKLQPAVLLAWARILRELPASRLRLQNAQLGDPAARQAMQGRLREHGIDPARVAMHGKQSRRAYLAAHAEVDLLLDTFPYPGGTTTCEALWMGVPTVTLEGDRMLSRQGAALLRAAGLDDWVASDLDGYVATALRHAGNPAALADLRRGLRDRVRRSPLFDGALFARRFEEAMWGMARDAGVRR